MIVFPNCKINLGLHILRKRADGYHDLETVFYPLPLFDALEVIQNPSYSGKEIELNVTGVPVDGTFESNICYKAYRLLKNDFPSLPAIQMHLHKAIPIGAGLGGGSADGAFALKLLNEKFRLGLNSEQLISFALQLGSDCPFFILNKPAYATGRGEKLEEVNLDLSSYKLVVVNPGIHINTGWAFDQLQPKEDGASLKEVIKLPPEQWQEHLYNDFEKPVFTHYPEISKIMDDLYAAGAVYSAMSGSGSTVFGLFKEPVSLPSFPEHYFVKIA
jgi:4-diphosphocytidyl-2-C-methyl-D-erythritol kinase